MCDLSSVNFDLRKASNNIVGLRFLIASDVNPKVSPIFVTKWARTWVRAYHRYPIRSSHNLQYMSPPPRAIKHTLPAKNAHAGPRTRASPPLHTQTYVVNGEDFATVEVAYRKRPRSARRLACCRTVATDGSGFHRLLGMASGV